MSDEQTAGEALREELAFLRDILGGPKLAPHKVNDILTHIENNLPDRIDAALAEKQLFIDAGTDTAIFLQGEIIEKDEKIKKLWDGGEAWRVLNEKNYNMAADHLIAKMDADARVVELEAELAKHQSSEFHPDWSLLKAANDSLKECHDEIARQEHRILELTGEA